jgi:hypothetical protein
MTALKLPGLPFPLEPTGSAVHRERGRGRVPLGEPGDPAATWRVFNPATVAQAYAEPAP